MRRVAVVPANRLRGLVVVTDVATNLPGEVGHGCEDAPGEQIAFHLREPELDLVKPGRIGRREVQVDVGMVEQKRAHRLGFVSLPTPISCRINSARLKPPV